MKANFALVATAVAIYLLGICVLAIIPARASIADAINGNGGLYPFPVEPTPPPVTCRIYGNAIYCG